MRISIRALRFLIKETHYYNMKVDKVINAWPRQFSDAIEFTAHELETNTDEAEDHVLQNWVFDTQKDGKETRLLARDESEAWTLAWMPNMGGWYHRLNSRKKQRPQSGKITPRSGGDGSEDKTRV